MLTPDSFSHEWVREGHTAFDAHARLRTPVIAVLDGDAFGRGLELAACADYRVAEEQVRVGQPETGIGVVPGWSGTRHLVHRFGAQPVRRMAVFGEVFATGEALGLGVVDSVVPRGKGLSAAENLARSLSSRPRRTVEITKMMIDAAEDEGRERVIDSLAGAAVAGTPELAEGVAACREKNAVRFFFGDTTEDKHPVRLAVSGCKRANEARIWTLTGLLRPLECTKHGCPNLSSPDQPLLRA